MKQLDSLQNIAKNWNVKDAHKGLRAEIKNLFDSSHLLPELFAFQNSFFFSIDYTSGNYGYISESIENVLGYSKEEVLSKGLNFMTTIVHQDDGQRIMKLLNQSTHYINLSETNEERCSIQLKYDFRIKHKNGHELWLLQQAYPIAFDDTGSMLCDFGVCTDITEYKQDTQSLGKVIKNGQVIFELT